MFRIIRTDGVKVGVTETLNYIKISPTSGCLVSAKKEDAVGIAFKSRPYNLYNHNEIKNAPVVIISEFDGGEKITDLERENQELSSHLEETDEAAIALYESSLIQEIANAEQDEAIIEIYEMIGELNNG